MGKTISERHRKKKILQTQIAKRIAVNIGVFNKGYSRRLKHLIAQDVRLLKIKEIDLIKRVRRYTPERVAKMLNISLVDAVTICEGYNFKHNKSKKIIFSEDYKEFMRCLT